MRLLLLIMALLVSGAVPAVAGPYEDAVAAYDKGDYTTALRLFRPFADQGDAGGQFNLGLMYAQGRGVPQDYATAAAWYRKAAERGYAMAQNNLGVLYAKGNGLPQEYVSAVSWYHKAAEQGYASSQVNLGAMYFYGHGVQQDYVLAYMWWSFSAAQGDANAAKNRDIVAVRMTPAQIAEAQKLAREWKPKPGR